MIVIIIIFISIIVLIFLLKHLKHLHLNSLTIITGGVKTGKTTLACFLAIKEYKRALHQYYFKKYFLFKRKVEKPLLYSNIPLKCKYPVYKIDKDLLLRITRFAYNSIVLISEASLVADSQNFKDSFVNDTLTCFNKLFAHETKGGKMFYDTQNISDVHYSIRRACSQYLWIHHNTKIPFLILMDVRELMYDDTNASVNVFNNDVADNNKLLIVPKSIWKCFDCYCYSILTDNNSISKIPYDIKKDGLKTKEILQLRDFKNFKKR